MFGANGLTPRPNSDTAPDSAQAPEPGGPQTGPAPRQGGTILRLTLLLHGLIGSTLAGVAVVVGLVAGLASLWPLLGAAATGWLIGWPVAWAVARRLMG